MLQANKTAKRQDSEALRHYFESDDNIFIASVCVDPQNSGSALKSEHTFGLTAAL